MKSQNAISYGSNVHYECIEVSMLKMIVKLKQAKDYDAAILTPDLPKDLNPDLVDVGFDNKDEFSSLSGH